MTQTTLTEALNTFAPKDAVLDIRDLSKATASVISALNISDSVESPDVDTLRYYRRDAVKILSEPVSSQGGYTRRHLLEALYARLTGATKTATLKDLSANMPSLTEEQLLEKSQSLLNTLNISSTAKQSLSKPQPFARYFQTVDKTPTHSFNSPLIGSPSSPSPSVSSMTMSAWPMPDGATLIMPANHPAFADPKKQEELTIAIQNVFSKKSE